MKNKMMRFVHDRHELYTVEQNKTSLSPINDKRYILENGVSHSFGHYSIDSADDGEDILCDGNQIALEPFSDSVFVGDRNQISVEEELVDGSFSEFNDNDMELVDVLDDLIC